MIRLLERSREISLQSSLSLLCALDFAAYENRYPFSQVWEWKNQGMTEGCLCLFYSEATAWAGEETGAAEIAEYLSALSWDSLLCTGEIARHLQDIPGRRKPIWALGARDLPGRKEERAVHPSEAEVYELLSMSVRGTLPSFDGWYCDRNHRARRGLMETWGIRDSRGLAATLTASGLDGQVYLSDIATRSDCRGQGYFRRLLGHVSAQYPERMLRLLTREENACRIYQRAGFVIEKENIVTIHKETNHAAGIF